VKRLLVAFGIVVCVAFAAPLVLSSVIDWNPYKGAVAERIGAAIGHRVEIDGELRFALLPAPILSVSGVRVANLPGAADADLLRLKRLDATISLWPLLGGRIQVERVLLDEPHLVYEVGADGVSNWRSTRVGTPFASGLAAAISFEGIVVRDGRILWRDRRNGREETVGDIAATIAAASLAGPFQGSGGFTVRGLELRAEVMGGRFAPGVTMPLRATVMVPGGGAVMKFAGIVAGDPAAGPRFRGDVRAEGGNLAATLLPVLSALGDGEVPDKALDQPFALRALLEADARRVALDSLEAEVGATRASGSVVLALGGTPDVTVALTANHVDLDPWAGLSPRGLLFAPPEGVTGTFDLGADVVSAGGGTVRQFRLEAKLADGALAIDRLSALLPGGADLSAAGSLEPENGVPTFDVQMEANADNLRALLDWFGLATDGVPADRLRKIALAGRLRARPDGFDFTGADLRFDATRLTGGLSFAARGRPAFGVQADIDRFNADAYGLRGAGAGALGGWLAKRADISLKATAGSITAGGQVLQGVALDASVIGGAADVRELKIADVAGVALSAEGRVLGPEPDSPAHVTLDLAGDSPAGLARVLAWPAWLPPPDGIGAFQVHTRLIGRPERLAVELKANALGASVDAAGTVEGWPGRGRFDLKTRIVHADAPNLLRRLRGWPVGAGTAMPCDLYAAIIGDGSDLAFDDLQGNLGAAALRGRLAADLDGTRPEIDGTLQLSALDVDRVVAVFLDTRRNDDPADLGWLNDLDGTLALTAAQAVALGQRIENPAARLKLEGGVLRLDRFDGTVFGGRFGLTARVDAGNDSAPAVSGEVTLSKARLADLPLPGGLRLSADAADGEAEFAAAGAGLPGVLRSLSGKGWISLKDGALGGIDVAAAAERLKRGQDGSAAPGERTAFTAAAVSFKAERGTLTSSDLRLSGGSASVKATGEWHPADGGIDARVSIGPRDGDSEPLAFRLSGSTERPRRTLEVATAPPGVLVDTAVPPDGTDAAGTRRNPTDVIRGLLEGLRR
jgi:uncharacterized protein involved in outer membrane biogenesis